MDVNTIIGDGIESMNIPQFKNQKQLEQSLPWNLK